MAPYLTAICNVCYHAMGIMCSSWTAYLLSLIERAALDNNALLNWIGISLHQKYYLKEKQHLLLLLESIGSTICETHMVKAAQVIEH